MNLGKTGSESRSAGVVYIATGLHFVEEALASAKSLCVHHPDLPVVLFTDIDPDFCKEVFPEIRRIENPTRSFADKIAPLSESPFEKTVFLDTDTRICAPIGDLFDLLDRFDLVAAHAPMRVTWPQPAIPDSFPEVNSGVLAWRKTEKTELLFAEWKRLYGEHLASTGQKDDQPALRRALFESDLNLGILPPEYNFRTVIPAFAGRGPVRIIHGRHPDMASVERHLNRHKGCRVVVPGDREFSPDRLVILSGGLRFPAAPLQFFPVVWFRIKQVLTNFKRGCQK